MAERRHLPGTAGLIRRRGRDDREHPVPPEPEPSPRRRAGLVDSAIYCNGRRATSPSTLAETFEALRSGDDAMAWIGLYRPGSEELNSLAQEFGLHELAVEDAITAHQRPKLERYGDTLFVVLRAARYLDDVEEVEFGELHVFLGKDSAIPVRHAERPDLGLAGGGFGKIPELLALGTRP